MMKFMVFDIDKCEINGSVLTVDYMPELNDEAKSREIIKMLANNYKGNYIVIQDDIVTSSYIKSPYDVNIIKHNIMSEMSHNGCREINIKNILRKINGDLNGDFNEYIITAEVVEKDKYYK